MYNIEDRDRVRKEVVILSEEENTQASNDPNEELDEELDEGEDEGDNGKSMPWLIITTGKILTEGSLPYHHYFIAIAFMCFFSIFLTFMSLNADREYRQREKYASVLHERVVLREEQRYELSSKSAVTNRLKSHGIELIELSKNSRIIEK
ncbi:MAG: hypothetical protein J6U48_01615 [Alistipes sp.]|jgi:hypothetical protein|nr:hypothetical protein [Alistipes sp.]